ncbi:MAG: phosphoesterase [Desulfobacteraceae bacterium]|nr:phosphoesterase [Desulfobacteraceae bacterium]
MDKGQERVFCIKRTDLEGVFGRSLPTGAIKGPVVDDILKLEAFFLPRYQAEHDSSYKQIIPYQIFCWDNRFLIYRRGSGIGEGRLSGCLSAGVGGHINIMDLNESDKKGSAFYHKALIRERMEELSGPAVIEEKFIGWINDETNAVGRVHLGAVHMCKVETRDGFGAKTGEDIHLAGWWTKEDIFAKKEMFETWSVYAMELFRGPRLDNRKTNPSFS